MNIHTSIARSHTHKTRSRFAMNVMNIPSCLSFMRWTENEWVCAEQSNSGYIPITTKKRVFACIDRHAHQFPTSNRRSIIILNFSHLQQHTQRHICWLFLGSVFLFYFFGFSFRSVSVALCIGVIIVCHV